MCIAAHSRPYTATSQQVRLGVSASCSTSPHVIFFWLKSESAVLRACCQLLRLSLQVIIHVALDGSSWKLPRRSAGGTLFSPHTCLTAYPVVLVRGSTPSPEPRVCGPCTCGEPNESQNQWSEADSEKPLSSSTLPQASVGVCTCLTPSVNSRVCCSCEAASIFARGLQAHSRTFIGSSMGSRSRTILEPWPLPPVHTALEIVACRLIGRVSSELDCCAIPLAAAGGGGIVAVPAGAVAGLDLGTQGGEVEVPLTGGQLRIIRILA